MARPPRWRGLGKFPRVASERGREVGGSNPLAPTMRGFMRRGAEVVERGGLENRCAFIDTEGSNPSLSASYFFLLSSERAVRILSTLSTSELFSK